MFHGASKLRFHSHILVSSAKWWDGGSDENEILSGTTFTRRRLPMILICLSLSQPNIIVRNCRLQLSTFTNLYLVLFTQCNERELLVFEVNSRFVGRDMLGMIWAQRAALYAFRRKIYSLSKPCFPRKVVEDCVRENWVRSRLCWFIKQLTMFGIRISPIPCLIRLLFVSLNMNECILTSYSVRYGSNSTFATKDA